SFSGGRELAVNTTTTAKTVSGFKVDRQTGAIITGQQLTIDPKTVVLVMGGDLNIQVAGLGVDLNGELDVTLGTATTTAFVHAGLNLSILGSFAATGSLTISPAGVSSDLTVTASGSGKIDNGT